MRSGADQENRTEEGDGDNMPSSGIELHRQQVAALRAILAAMPEIAVAVSGGVDSLTLSVLAHRTLGAGTVRMFHAVSPAVPPEATARVREIAGREGWLLSVIDAGEFASAEYRENPVNRCFYCKTHLYAAVRRHTGMQILSGTNLDDLGEYRPGLDAAREHGVRHPFVEAGIDKRTVRAIARGLGLGDIAELPAAPCLSSRVETGIRIEAGLLALVHAVERLAAAELTPRTVRCRVRPGKLVVELDEASLTRLGGAERGRLAAAVEALAQEHGLDPRPVSFAPYRTGSAFLVGGRVAAAETARS
ncbi:MAG TPA: hypothetical protein VGD08_16775 [Stellaceae bacterium]